VTRAAPFALLAAAATAAVLVAAGGGAAAPPAAPPPPTGPLGTDEVTGMGVPQQVGRPFSIGLPVVYNRGDRPATIERIALVEKSPGIELLETHVNGIRRNTLLTAFTYRWPERGAYTDLHSPRGYVVPPQRRRKGRRGVELVFVLRVDAPGAHQFAGARVDYRIGSRRYRTTLWEGARICAVPQLPERVEPNCDPIDLSAKTYE
jgi:hypothetical protein